jgi:mannose-6-phosphate isomerase-like protein (cupin superfamily)
MAEGRGIVRRPGEARTIDLGGFGVVVLADETATDGAFSLIETAEAEPGGGPPLHIHHDAAESFYVIAGAYRMHIEGEDFECPAGSFIHVPKGLRHTFQPIIGGSRKLNLYTPAGMVGYFDELAEGIRAGMGDAELDAIAERYAMEVVGPVPEGYL